MRVVGQMFALGEDTAASYGAVTVEDGGTLTIGGGSVIDVRGTLTVTGNSTLLLQGKNTTDQVSGQWAGEGVTIRAGNIKVDSGSKISADGQGYTTSKGPGAGPTRTDGGSYGGRGGWNSGPTYGSGVSPTDLGSGGGSDSDGWSHGGGAIRLEVSGTLTLNGDITASGVIYVSWWGAAASGGSGGSIYVTAGVLAGSGKFTANGASGTYYGVGGGGGRIAVYYGSGAGFTGFAASTVSAGTARDGYPLAQDGTVAFFDTSYPNTLMSVYRRFVFDEDTSIHYGAIVLSNGGILEMGGGVRVFLDQNLTVGDGSTVLLRGKNTDRQYGGRWAGVGVKIHASNILVDATSKISADGEGYMTRQGPGAGPGGDDGGSYGGQGGGSTGPTYGSAMMPVDLGSGGGGDGSGGSGDGWSRGGGAIRLDVSDTLTVNGKINSDGVMYVSGWTVRASGGSRGSVYISAQNITGSGTITANGGPRPYYGTTGGGGRIAIHYWGAMSLPTANVTASAGGAPAGDGTVILNHDQTLYNWADLSGSLFHDTKRVGWEALAADPGGMTVEIIASISGASYSLSKGLPPMGEFDWDTKSFVDGIYELRAVFRDGSSQVVGQAIRTVLLNNSVVWHSGWIEASETWHAGTVHVVEGDVSVRPGVTLTIEPDVIVKFAQGTGIIVEDGVTLNALGVPGHPVVFTALTDDTVGGDTNLDGGTVLPIPGYWNGISVKGGGQLNLSDSDVVRYIGVSHSGTITSGAIWFGTYVHHVTGDLTIAAGGSLTIQPGAVVKFDALKGIVVQSGGSLVARGTVAQPIFITTIKDDSVGGDTNGDGNSTSPAAGDWRWIYVNGGDTLLDHVLLSYGGGTSSGNWDQTGMVKSDGGATLTISNSILRESFFDGVLAWGGPATITSSVLTGIDRAVCAHPGSPVQVINCTLDDNRIGLLVHGGTLDVSNTIVTNSMAAGIQFEFGTLSSVRYTNVWSPSGSGSVNYSNTSDLSG